jgi:hypothetical protein
MSQVSARLTDIINRYKQGQDVRPLVQALNASELNQLRLEIGRLQEEYQEEIWRARRTGRRLESELEQLTEDQQRINESLSYIQQKLLGVFERTYRNPLSAARRLYRIEEQHGLDKAELLLRHRPWALGELKGQQILGFSLGKRQEALEYIKTAPYKELREQYTKERQLLEMVNKLVGSGTDEHENSEGRQSTD